MATWTIYYNPKCATCRNTMDILKKKGIEPRVVEYLKSPPSKDEIESMLTKLQIEPEQLARKKESIFKELGLDSKKLSRQDWIRIFHENPVLIERPVVMRDDRAVIARPPETVEQLF